MNRRTFIAGLGIAAAWPMVARGQQSAMPMIGYLYAGEAEADRLIDVPPVKKVQSRPALLKGRM